MKALGEKQRKFCERYILTGNATQSYLDAGYADGPAIAANAIRLLKNDKAREYLRELQAAQTQVAIGKTEKILAEFEHLAYHQISDICSFDGTKFKLFPMNEWPDRAKAAVKAIDFKTGKITFHDKNNALNSLARIHGLTSDFDTSIANLKSYGLHITRSKDGTYTLRQEQ